MQPSSQMPLHAVNCTLFFFFAFPLFTQHSFPPPSDATCSPILKSPCCPSSPTSKEVQFLSPFRLRHPPRIPHKCLQGTLSFSPLVPPFLPSCLCVCIFCHLIVGGVCLLFVGLFGCLLRFSFQFFTLTRGRSFSRKHRAPPFQKRHELTFTPVSFKEHSTASAARITPSP